jgi:hypothetical protein
MSKPTILLTAGHCGGGNALFPLFEAFRRDRKADFTAIAYDVVSPAWQKEPHTVLEQAYARPSYETAQWVLGAVKPALVITGTAAKEEKHDEAHVWDKQVVAAANTLGIPTISVLDAWMNYGIRFHNTDTDKRWCYLPTKIAIMDQYARNGFVDDGMPDELQRRLVETGNPAHDSIAQRRAMFTDNDQVRIRATLGLEQGKPAVFYATSWLEPDFGQTTDKFLGFTDRTVLDELIPALAALNPVPQLFIRMHPRERKDWPDRYDAHVARAQSLGVHTVLFNSENPRHSDLEKSLDNPAHQYILASDMFCSPTSSLLAEAAMLDKPAVSLQMRRLPGKTNYAAPFSDLGVVRCVDRKEYLLGSMQDALLQKSAFKPFAVSGKATENVAKLAYQMLGC